MARPKKTDSEMETARGHILDTALNILREEGPEAISSRAIALRMGVAHMSLYTYFDNQGAILRALSERELAKWRARQQALERRTKTGDITRIVEKALGMFVAFARNNPNLFRLAWVMPEMGGETAGQTLVRMQDTAGYLSRLVKAGMEKNDFEAGDPFLRAVTILGMINMPYFLFHSGKLKDPVLRERMAKEMLGAAMLYLKKK